MSTSPILLLGFLVILTMMFLVVPFWIVLKLKLPRWQKGLLAFNYYALLLILYVHIMTMGSLAVANTVAKHNLETLIRVLRTEPVAKVTAALDKYLAHDESSYFLLSTEFPEPKAEVENAPASEPRAEIQPQPAGKQ